MTTSAMQDLEDVSRAAWLATAGREPGCDDDDVDELEDLVPIGLLLREMDIDEREHRVSGVEATRREIEAMIKARQRESLVEVAHGRRSKLLEQDGEETCSLWRLLARMTLIEVHGGEVSTWVTGRSRGEWLVTLRHRCSKRGCRHCPRQVTT